MADNKTLRLNKVLRELNISLDRAVEHLTSHGIEIEARPTTKISNEEYEILLDGFQTDRSKKAASKEVGEEKRKEKEALRVATEEKQEKHRLEEEAKRVVVKAKADKLEVKTVGKIDIEPKKEVSQPIVEKSEPIVEPESKAVEKEIKTEEIKVEVVKKSSWFPRSYCWHHGQLVLQLCKFSQASIRRKALAAPKAVVSAMSLYSILIYVQAYSLICNIFCIKIIKMFQKV